jgi:hypothetical protein
MTANCLAKTSTLASGAQASRQMRSNCCGVRRNGVGVSPAITFPRQRLFQERTVERHLWVTRNRYRRGQGSGIQTDRQCRHTDYASARPLRVEGSETAPLLAVPFQKLTNGIRLQYSDVIVDTTVGVCGRLTIGWSDRAGCVFGEPRRGSMMWINCLRLASTSRVAQPHR